MKKILIVDDEADILELVASCLEGEGYSVQTASSGNQALTLTNTEKFDLVITDIMMPDGDGIFLADEIRKKDLNFPYLFFMTGYSDYTDAEAYSKGVNEIFHKPFDFAELVQIVAQYL